MSSRAAAHLHSGWIDCVELNVTRALMKRCRKAWVARHNGQLPVDGNGCRSAAAVCTAEEASSDVYRRRRVHFDLQLRDHCHTLGW